MCDHQLPQLAGTLDRAHQRRDVLGKRTFTQLVACWLLLASQAAVFCAPPPELPLLTAAEQVRKLSPDEARRGYPVRLEAVVLDFHQPTFSDLMVQDATAGIYVDGIADQRYQLRSGQRVRIEGITGCGEFAPIVVGKNVVVLGDGALPEPRTVSLDRFMSGAEDGQWVAIDGIIRAAAIDSQSGRLTLKLATGGRVISARVTNFDPASIDRLVDAEATITGVNFPRYNRKGQLRSMRLSVPGTEQIRIQVPGPEDPFALPIRTIASLLRFDPAGPHGHRVKVAGVVTLQQPGAALFIRDETQGLWIRTRQPLAVQPGDRIEVVGFPLPGEYSPVLEDASFRRIGSDQPPAPKRLTVEEARDGNHDADLIQVDGRLVEESRSGGERVLTLRHGEISFRANLHDHPVAAELRPLSTLRLTGICLPQVGDERWPKDFRLLLRSPADIEVLAQPSWWTFRRVLVALVAMTCIFLIATAWAITLQYRVRVQTAVIRQKAQREAVLEERGRIAREFHDTLEQELAGVGMQLDTAAAKLDQAPDLARRILSVARSMLRHTRSEAKRSVWELRTRALQEGDLGAALNAVARHAAHGADTRFEVSVDGKPQPIPGPTESHLLRIGQEAITNAIKHAEPKNVSLFLRYEADAVRLTVVDDGRGFDVDSAESAGAEHFGLIGMRERAERINARLTFSSRPGEGTRVEVIVPQAAPAPA